MTSEPGRSRTEVDSGAGPELATILDVACNLAHLAGEVTLRYFGDVVASEAKTDGTPVTEADREAETLLRGAILDHFPTHGILGEEFGEHEGRDPIRWILDPIDGTRSFMRGVPLYAVLIGVEVKGEPAVGVVHMPALGETIAAARGMGCHWWPSTGSDPRPAQVSVTPKLADGLVLTTSPREIHESELGAGWRDLAGTAEFVRGWGDAYGHALVATGRAEVMVDPVLSPWDAAPLLTVVSEAGGSFTDLEGTPTIHGGSGVSTNGALHAATLEVLNRRR